MFDLISSQICSIESGDIVGTINANDTHHIETNQVFRGLYFSSVFERDSHGRMMGKADLFTTTSNAFDYFAQRANALIEEWRKDGKLICRSGSISYDNGYFYIQLIGKNGLENLKLGLSDARVYKINQWPLALV